jgi:hypothetical protein
VAASILAEDPVDTVRELRGKRRDQPTACWFGLGSAICAKGSARAGIHRRAAWALMWHRHRRDATRALH